jgi:hypothetical protein
MLQSVTKNVAWPVYLNVLPGSRFRLLRVEHLVENQVLCHPTSCRRDAP